METEKGADGGDNVGAMAGKATSSTEAEAVAAAVA